MKIQYTGELHSRENIESLITATQEFLSKHIKIKIEQHIEKSKKELEIYLHNLKNNISVNVIKQDDGTYSVIVEAP